MAATHLDHRPAPDLLGLVPFALVAVAVAGLGSVATSGTVDSAWFDALPKPSWYPPSATFGIVWTILYAGIAVAGWLAWRADADRLTLALWGGQMALNLGWTLVFFGLRRPGWAVAEILVLLAAVVVTGVGLGRFDRRAGLLFVPYAAWVAFATALTIAIATG